MCGRNEYRRNDRPKLRSGVRKMTSPCADRHLNHMVVTDHKTSYTVCSHESSASATPWLDARILLCNIPRILTNDASSYNWLINITSGVLIDKKSFSQMSFATIWTIRRGIYSSDAFVPEMNALSRSISSNIILDESLALYLWSN